MNFLKKPICFWMNLQAWLKIIIGMFLGLVLGLVLGPDAVVFKPIGTMFINGIMMLVAPVVFVSLVCGVMAMRDPAKMGRIALKTFGIYFLTMASGSAIALFFSKLIFAPGKGVSLSSLSLNTLEVKSQRAFSFIDTIVSMVPSNIMVSFAEANILQVIVFAIIFGISINLAGEAAKPVETFFRSLSVVIFKLISIIMSFAPYGICALLAVVAGTQGLDVIKALLHMIGVVYICCLVGMTTIYGTGLSLAKLNPLMFFKKIFEAQVVAFSTTSSAATLPVNLKVAENKMGVSRSVAGFVLPLGSTVNMDGLSTYMGVIAIFTANIYGVELSLGDMLTIVLTSTIAAIGCAGVPAAGLIVLPMVLSSVGLPLDVIGLIAAVHRLIDMISTSMNITGDAFASVVIAKSEKELNLEIYNDGKAISDSPHASTLDPIERPEFA